MSVSLDERARDAGAALRVAAELRPTSAVTLTPRRPVRALLTAALLVIIVAVAAIVAVRAASPRKGGTTSHPPSGRYESRCLLRANDPKLAFATLRRDAALLRSGVVPQQAAQTLQYSGTISDLLAQVQVNINPRIRTISVTATQTTASQAERVVNELGRQFVAHLERVASTRFSSRLRSARHRMHSLQAQVVTVDRRWLADQRNSEAKAQLDGLRNSLQIAQRTYGRWVTASTHPRGYTLLATHSAQPVRRPSREHSNTALLVIVGTIGALALLGAGFLLGRRRPRRAVQA